MYKTIKTIYRTFSLFVFLFIGLLSLQFQCSKSFQCAEAIYNFELGIKAYPDKDSINVGDTLWMEVNTPTLQIEVQTGRTIDYSGAVNLGTAISFAKLYSVGETNDQVANEFIYVLIQGKEVQRPGTAKYREFLFPEANGFYRFRLGIVPKEKGVYKLFISNASSVYRFNDKCTKANFAINFKETDQHFYFNEVSFPDIALSGKNGVYLFKVK